MTSSGVFVVSTGRCGSTLVTNALREHPAVLSVSEFLSALDERVLDHNILTYDALTQPHPHTTALLVHGLDYEEILYDVDDSRSRFDRQTGVPPLLLTTLPHLTGDTVKADGLYDDLLDDLAPAIRHLPPAEGYERVFSWLVARYEKREWVERSGSSLRFIRPLVTAFPTSRFVHLHREGWPTALSMQRHNGFRFELLTRKLKAHLGVDPYIEHTEIDLETVPPPLRRLLPDTLSREAFLDYSWPVREFALWWSTLSSSGIKVLSTLPADQVLHVSYERLVSDPSEWRRLGEFVTGEAPPAWVDKVTRLVRPSNSMRTEAPDEASAWMRRGIEAIRSVSSG